MKIDKNNYEAYFTDYLDGNLDENIVDDFIEFLERNPELKEELALIENTGLPDDEIVFGKKEMLRKERFDCEEEFNMAAVATVEGDIPAHEKTEFERYLKKHDNKERDLLLFKATKLRPDKSIVFSSKQKLYKKPVRKVIFLWSGRVAAILILAFAIFSLINRAPDTVKKENKNIIAQSSDNLKTVTGDINKSKETTDKTEISGFAEKPVKVKKDNAVKIKDKNREKTYETTVPAVQPVLTVRTETEIPAELKPVEITINTEINRPELAVMTISLPDEDYNEEKLFGDRIKEKAGIDKLNLKKITRTGLSVVSAITNNKFKYETNNDGEITKYRYDSRILAFSIPAKGKK